MIRVKSILLINNYQLVIDVNNNIPLNSRIGIQCFNVIFKFKNVKIIKYKLNKFNNFKLNKNLIF